MLTIAQLLEAIESIAPHALQESYDNAGLIFGHPNRKVERAMMCLDVTEDVVQEAVDRNAQCIISHHPLVFKGIKKLTGSNAVERTLLKAIQHDIALIAAHTNLDNVQHGVNKRIAEKLGLQDTRILRPLSGKLVKLAVFVPNDAADTVRDALFAAGAGHIGAYDKASFNLQGKGSFRGDETSSPTIGKPGEMEWVDEVRIEVILHQHKLRSVLNAMETAHPYEEVAHDIYPLANTDQTTGAGMIGLLPEAEDAKAFLQRVKETFQCGVIRHTNLCKDNVQRIAFCGGSGFFLLNDAKRAKADVYLTGDIKYHDFFEAENQLILADIGHYESEQFTAELLIDLMKQKFPNFAFILSGSRTNPVHYL